MSINTLSFLGRLGSEAVRRVPPICNVELSVTSEPYTASTVTLRRNGAPVLITTQPLFHRFCDFARGKPVRKWPDVMLEREMNDMRITMPVDMTTTEQNLLKASFVVYLWLEPFFVGRPTEPLSTVLIDECIIDYSGSAGVQPFFYFPPSKYQAPADDPVMNKLFDLQLVCRLQAEIAGQAVTRWFTPLVIPGVLVDHFGENPTERRTNYQKWQGIKEQLQGTVERLFRRKG